MEATSTRKMRVKGDVWTMSVYRKSDASGNLIAYRCSLGVWEEGTCLWVRSLGGS